MSSTHDPTQTASTHPPSPATHHDVDVDELDDDDDASSDVSCGGNLRDDLEDALKGDFNFKGKFALSDTFSSTPLPGLCIQGIGVIGFPLSDRDAKLIETTATQAPFGKGSETVVDTAVRDTFEINPDRFSFKNSAWSDFLQTVTKKMADGLGSSPRLPPPRAELYKLLLYKTGSHFLPHKDTEKTQGMFASLIIVLPSKFEGGQVHVSHGSDNDVFNVSPDSEFTTSALAWYTDVTHEVKPITSGYRLAISYNLVNTVPGIPPPHLPDMHSAVSLVEGIFRRWRKGGYDDDDEFSGTIAYLLDHEYSEAGLEFAALKGKDATLISNIREVAEKQGICLRLGILECEVSGDANVFYSDDEWGPPPKMEEVHDTEYRIEGLYDLEGDLAKGRDSISLNPEFDMIPQDPGFEGQVPDDKEFEGYTGNEGAPIKYWYRRSVLVMYLDREESSTLLGIGGPDYAFNKLRRWKGEGPTERNRRMIQFLINHRSLSLRWQYTPPEHLTLLIDLALEWGDFTTWKEVLKKNTSDEHTPRLSLDVLIRAWDVFTFDRTKNIIEKVIRNQPSTRATIDWIRALQAHDSGQDPSVKTWLKQQTTAVLSSIKSPPSDADVQMFVSIAKSEGLLFFSQTIMKQLLGFKGIFDFWVGLAEGLWKEKDELMPSGGTPEEASAYTNALNHILDSLIVTAIPEYCTGVVVYGRYNSSTFAKVEEPRILRLLDTMVLTGRIQNSDQLITLVSRPQGNLADKYQNLIIPLVPKLKARYQQYCGSYLPVLDAFLRAFVERWLQDLLGIPSKQPDSLVKKLVCGCEDCARVNRFLQSDNATETFWAAQKRRSHMEANLRKSVPDAVVLTTTTGRSPYGLKVTKTHKTLAVGRWNGRVENARAFLTLVGTPDVLARIMAERHQDVQAALAGTKPYKIGNSIPVVVSAEDAPTASTSAAQATASEIQTGPVVAGVKRKAEDDGEVIDLTSD